MDYSSSFPITWDIDFSSACCHPAPINFDAVGETVFPTQNILGVNKNMDTIVLATSPMGVERASGTTHGKKR